MSKGKSVRLSVSFAERELIARAQKKGDEGAKVAFGVLWKDNEDKIRRFISGRFGWKLSHHDIEDVCQNAALRAQKYIGSFEGKSSFSTWINRIAYNCCLDFLKSKEKHGFVYYVDDLSEDSLEGGMNPKGYAEHQPENILVAEQLEEGLAKVINDLPFSVREAFALRVRGNHCYDAIAEIMGTPIGTVRSRIFHARHCIEIYINQ